MADILIVNPSVNMKIVAQELKSLGNNVNLVSVSDIPVPDPARVFYFFAGYTARFTTEPQGEIEKEDRALIFKPGLISRIRLMGVQKSLELINPELVNGNFTDLLAFRRGALKYEPSENESEISFPNLREAAAAYPQAFILASYYAGAGNLKFCLWDTDFDLKETFGGDYFVFFASGVRIEAFSLEGRLITMAKGRNHIKALSGLIPTLNKFSFSLLEEKNVMKNPNPWIQEGPLPGMKLINDYSFGKVSVSMPSQWYDKLAAAINFSIEKNKSGTKNV